MGGANQVGLPPSLLYGSSGLAMIPDHPDMLVLLTAIASAQLQIMADTRSSSVHEFQALLTDMARTKCCNNSVYWKTFLNARVYDSQHLEHNGMYRLKS